MVVIDSRLKILQTPTKGEKKNPSKRQDLTCLLAYDYQKQKHGKHNKRNKIMDRSLCRKRKTLSNLSPVSRSFYKIIITTFSFSAFSEIMASF